MINTSYRTLLIGGGTLGLAAHLLNQSNKKNNPSTMTAEKIRQKLQTFPQHATERELNLWTLRNADCAWAARFEGREKAITCLQLKNALTTQLFSELNEWKLPAGIPYPGQRDTLRTLATQASELYKEVSIVTADAEKSERYCDLGPQELSKENVGRANRLRAEVLKTTELLVGIRKLEENINECLLRSEGKESSSCARSLPKKDSLVASD
jgi:hypothetical protein